MPTAVSTQFYPNGSLADNGKTFLLSAEDHQVQNPAVKKYGVFDKFDGYYFSYRIFEFQEREHIYQ